MHTRYEGELDSWRGRYEGVLGETERARQRAETLGWVPCCTALICST